MSHADGTMAALSRQLVQAKMAEAAAQRKLRLLLPYYISFGSKKQLL